jgi:hypothetical protein
LYGARFVILTTGLCKPSVWFRTLYSSITCNLRLWLERKS